MTTRTPLHTRYETISRYADIATELLHSLSTDVETMLLSNDDEQAENADERRVRLAERMDAESWTEQTTQDLRDVMYLLAVGDNGPTAVADADPERASKQAHYERRRAALERLSERGLLEG